MNREIRRLASLGPSGIAVLCRALLVLTRVRIALWVLPWNRVAAPAARSNVAGSARPGLDRLEWSVRTAGRFIPRSTCLTQALALHRLLSRYGYRSSVQIGVRNVDGRFGAHAWVEHQGSPLLSSAAEIAGYARFFSWPASQPDLT